MALKWTNQQDIDRYFRLLQEEYEAKAIKWLTSLGERVVNYARKHGSYTDRTRNLRNSIGYAIVRSGNIIVDGFGVSEPQSKARAHAIDVASGLKGNKTYLVWVAGMEYARYVEAKGYDVIEGSGNWIESIAQELIEEFKRYLMSNK